MLNVESGPLPASRITDYFSYLFREARNLWGVEHSNVQALEGLMKSRLSILPDAVQSDRHGHPCCIRPSNRALRSGVGV